MHRVARDPAVYKVAARWSDGFTGELKTYSLACKGCLPDLFRQARTKRDRCRLRRAKPWKCPPFSRCAQANATAGSRSAPTWKRYWGSRDLFAACSRDAKALRSGARDLARSAAQSLRVAATQSKNSEFAI